MKNLFRIVPVTLCATTFLIASAGITFAQAIPDAIVPPNKQRDANRAGPPTNVTTPGAATRPQPPVVVRQNVPVDPASFIVKAEPAELDLGDVPTNDSAKGSLVLHNTGDKPMTVVSSRASCGCTSLKLLPNTIIPAGEKIEVQVQLNGGANPGPINGKTVTFIVEGQPELVVKLKANAVSFVAADPTVLDPSVNKEGKLTLRATDGKPFKVMSMTPAVIAEFPKEPQTEITLNIDWDKYRQMGINRRTTFFLDHPKCQQVVVTTNFKPEEFAAQAQKQAEAMKGSNDAIGDRMKPDPAVTRTSPAPDPDTVLRDLINDKKNDEVLKRIASGLDVNYKDASGMSLLGMAAKAGNVELIQALVATKKVDIDGADNVGRTALMHAATSKNVEAVRAMLKAGAAIKTRDTIGGTALTWAAGLGDAESVRELIDAGSDVQVVGAITGWTPLIWAAGFGDAASIDPLINAHADIEAADQLQGATPLIHAARTGKVESIKALIKRGAKLENVDKNGNTALLAAAGTSGGTAEKVKALIDAKCNVKARDNRGFNALELAEKRTDVRAAEVIAILEPLLKNEPKHGDAEGKPATAK